ncbi:hypothetical protein D5086_005962 [Populus alba]|uniref:Uncharacterized protein n=1 Tax=Populus alba TaxID=43335 RepID=A0ACC4CKG9_POPAL
MAEDEHILPCPISYIRRNVKTPKRQDTCLADIDSTVSDWVHSPWSLSFWASSGACHISIDNLPFALISSIHSWAPTTPCPPHWQLPRRTTCITTAGDGGGILKDLGTDKSSLMLFVPERASYARETNAVQKIYRDDAVYCQYRSWTFLCLDIDLPFSPPSFSHTTWLVSTKRHTATTKCPCLYPIRES